jgi:hypothetical protein
MRRALVVVFVSVLILSLSACGSGKVGSIGGGDSSLGTNGSSLGGNGGSIDSLGGIGTDGSTKSISTHLSNRQM